MSERSHSDDEEEGTHPLPANATDRDQSAVSLARLATFLAASPDSHELPAWARDIVFAHGNAIRYPEEYVEGLVFHFHRPAPVQLGPIARGPPSDETTARARVDCSARSTEGGFAAVRENLLGDAMYRPSFSFFDREPLFPSQSLPGGENAW